MSYPNPHQNQGLRPDTATVEALTRELESVRAYSKLLREALEEQRRQMDYPGLPPAFAATMKRMIDAALSENPAQHKCGEACPHASDCAVHNAPAYPAGECTCGAENPAQKTITIDNPSYGPWLAQHQRNPRQEASTAEFQVFEGNGDFYAETSGPRDMALAEAKNYARQVGGYIEEISRNRI